MMEINPLQNRKLFRFTFLALYNLFLQQQLWKHKCARCVWQLAWEQQTMRCCWVIYSLLIWWGVSLRRLKKKNRLQCVVQQSHEFRLLAALFWILLIIKYEKCVFNVLLLLKYPFSSWVQTWTPHKKCFVLCIHTFLHLSTSDPEQQQTSVGGGRVFRPAVRDLRGSGLQKASMERPGHVDISLNVCLVRPRPDVASLRDDQVVVGCRPVPEKGKFLMNLLHAGLEEKKDYSLQQRERQKRCYYLFYTLENEKKINVHFAGMSICFLFNF